MRKFLTTCLFGAILGLAVGAPADAALVSRGFLDEALGNYATTTALDLKADQSDFTELSNIVGTPAELTYRDIIESASSAIVELMGMDYYDAYGDNTVPTNNISELIRLNYTDIDFPGLAGVVQSLFYQRDEDDYWPVRLTEIFNDYEYLFLGMGHVSFTNIIIDGGTLQRSGVTVYGLKDLTTKVDANTAKIGTLPTEYATVGAALTAIKGIAEDAKAAALSAIPDPKTEGSTGKFVLTVDIVGDNATYRWEKIDREDETTTTTE